VLIAIACTGTLLTGCTETETIEPPAQPANRILTYTVVNTPDPVHGAVNDNDSTITVYLPYYYYLSLMQTELTVSEGATVTPDSGTTLDDLVRVIKGDTVIRYTVTDTKGKKKTYTLHVETQQPALEIDEITTDAAAPKEFASSYLYQEKYEVYTAVPITGKNLFKNIGNQTQVTVTFINEQGTEISAVDVNVYSTTSITAILPFHWQMAPGLYRVRVECYSHTITIKNPIRIKSPQ